MNKFLIEDLYNNNVYYLSGISNVSGSKRSTITQYATPSGTKISDNSFVEPKTLSFSLITSHIASNSQGVARSGIREINSETTEELKNIEINPVSIEELKNIINYWQDNAIRLNITTFEGYYPNMVLSQTQVTEGDRLGIWEPNLTFTEVRQAQAEYIKLDFPKDAKEKADGSEEQNLGADIGSGIGTVVGSAGAGALLGAAVGSVVPVIGTGLGAIIGAVAGAFIGHL